MLCLTNMTCNNVMTHIIYYSFVLLLLLTLLIFSPILYQSVLSLHLSVIFLYSCYHSQCLPNIYNTITISTVARAYVMTCLI